MSGASWLDEVFPAVVRAVLDRHPDDVEGRMLQAPGLRTSGRFYAFAPADALVVKLPASRVATLVAEGRGLPCSPRPGRPMREWVVVPHPDEAEATAFALESRGFVAGDG